MRKFLLAVALVSAVSWTAVSAQAQDQSQPHPAPDATLTGPPAYSTTHSTIGDLLDNPQTKAIVDAYLPDFSTSAQANIARTLTFREMRIYSPLELTEQVLTDMDAQLAKVPPKTTD